MSFPLKIRVRGEEGEMPIIEATCRSCQGITNITVTRDQLGELVTPGRRARNIEEILPDHTPDERELFISGLCGGCFDKLWGEEEPYEPIDAVCDVCGAVYKEDQLEASTRGDTTWWLCPHCVQE